MHDVACEFARAFVRSKDAQKQLARTSLKENEHLFRYRAWLEGNFFRCVRARVNLRALMTQKSCAVGMRNAILRNHLKRTRKEKKMIF